MLLGNDLKVIIFVGSFFLYIFVNHGFKDSSMFSAAYVCVQKL